MGLEDRRGGWGKGHGLTGGGVGVGWEWKAVGKHGFTLSPQPQGSISKAPNMLSPPALRVLCRL